MRGTSLRAPLTALLAAVAAAALAAGAAAEGGIEAALRDLRSPDAGKRIEAAFALGEAKDAAALPALADALGDAYPPVRSEAARAIGAIGGPEAFRLLRDVLAGKDDPRREAAVVALGDLGTEEALDLLGGLCWSKDEAIWRRAMATLEEIGRRDLVRAQREAGGPPLPKSIPPELREALEELRKAATRLDRRDFAEREAAGKKLARFLPDHAEHFLSAARADPPRAHLFMGPVAATGGRVATEALVRGSAPEEPPEVQQASFQGFGKVRDEEGLAVLAAALRGAALRGRSAQWAVSALWSNKWTGAVATFVAVLESEQPEDVRAEAAAGLVRLEEPEAAPLPAIVRLLEAKGKDARERGLQILYFRRDDPAVLGPLVGFLDRETDPSLAAQARATVADILRVGRDHPDLLALARKAAGGAAPDVDPRAAADAAVFAVDLARARRDEKPPLGDAIEPAPELVAPPGWIAFAIEGRGTLVARPDPLGRAPVFAVERGEARPTALALSALVRRGAVTLPNGDLVELRVAEREGGGGEAWLVRTPAAGGEERVLFARRRKTRRPAPPALAASRDARLVAFPVDGHVFVVDTETGSGERLLLAEEYGDPLLSPDGAWLVAPLQVRRAPILASRDGKHLRRLAGVDARPFLAGAPELGAAAWLADSRVIVFAGLERLHLADIEGRTIGLPLAAEGAVALVQAAGARRVVLTGRSGAWLVDLSRALEDLAKGEPPAPPWAGRGYPDLSTPEAAYWTLVRAAREADARVFAEVAQAAELEGAFGAEGIEAHERERVLRELGVHLEAPSVRVEQVSDERAVVRLAWPEDPHISSSVTFVRKEGRWVGAPRPESGR